MRKPHVMQEPDDIRFGNFLGRHLNRLFKRLPLGRRCRNNKVTSAFNRPKTKIGNPLNFYEARRISSHEGNGFSAHDDSQREKSMQIWQNHKHRHAPQRQNEPQMTCSFKKWIIRCDMANVQDGKEQYAQWKHGTIQRQSPQWWIRIANFLGSSLDLAPGPRFAPFYLRSKQIHRLSQGCDVTDNSRKGFHGLRPFSWHVGVPSRLMTYLKALPYESLPGSFSPLKSPSAPTVQTMPRPAS